LNQLHWRYCPVRYGMCFLSVATIALLFVLCQMFARPSTRADVAQRAPYDALRGRIMSGILVAAIGTLTYVLLYQFNNESVVRRLHIDRWLCWSVGIELCIGLSLLRS